MKFQSEGYECVALDIFDSGSQISQGTIRQNCLTYHISALKERINSFFQNSVTKPDVWVNCAYPRTDKFGTSCEGSLDYEDWCHNVDASNEQCMFISSEVAQWMSRSGGGVIVNVASIYGMRAPRFEIYDGTKWACPLHIALSKQAL